MSVSREEFDKQTQAILDALEGFDAVLTKLKMDLGSSIFHWWTLATNPIQKLTGADEYAVKLDWEPKTSSDPNVKPYEMATQTGGDAFDGLKTLIKMAVSGLQSKSARYWLMFEETRIARRKK